MQPPMKPPGPLTSSFTSPTVRHAQHDVFKHKPAPPGAAQQSKRPTSQLVDAMTNEEDMKLIDEETLRKDLTKMLRCVINKADQQSAPSKNGRRMLQVLTQDITNRCMNARHVGPHQSTKNRNRGRDCSNHVSLWLLHALSTALKCFLFATLHTYRRRTGKARNEHPTHVRLANRPWLPAIRLSRILGRNTAF